jgi:hypothetical protein
LMKAGDREVGENSVKVASAGPHDSVRGQEPKQGICLSSIPAAFQQLQRRQAAEGDPVLFKGIKPCNRRRVTPQEVDQNISVNENHNQAGDDRFDRPSRSSLANWAVLRISLRSFHMPARPESARSLAVMKGSFLLSLPRRFLRSSDLVTIGIPPLP